MVPPWFKKLTPFHQALRETMKLRGMTQEEFAKKIGVSRGFLSHVLLGNAPPPMKVIGAWIQKLDLEQQHADYLHDLAALTCADDRVLKMFDRNHPALETILMAQTNQVLEDSVAYNPGESVELLKTQLVAAEAAKRTAEQHARDLQQRLDQIQALLGRPVAAALPPADAAAPLPKKVPLNDQ